MSLSPDDTGAGSQTVFGDFERIERLSGASILPSFINPEKQMIYRVIAGLIGALMAATAGDGCWIPKQQLEIWA